MVRDVPSTGPEGSGDWSPAGAGRSESEALTQVEAKARLLDGPGESGQDAEAVAARAPVDPSRARVEAKAAALDGLVDPEYRPPASAPDLRNLDTPAQRKAQLLDQAYLDRASDARTRAVDQNDGLDGAEPPGTGEARDAVATPESEGASDTATDTPSPRSRMSQETLWSRHPGDYVRPDASIARSEVHAPFQRPGEWASKANPWRGDLGGDGNCGECARATELTWRGTPALAGVLADRRFGSELDARMVEWADKELRPTEASRLADDLKGAGRGSSALIAVDWDDGGGGHWFNAVNHEGRILSVDGQSGAVEERPSSVGVSDFEPADFGKMYAITFGPDGVPLEGSREDQ